MYLKIVATITLRMCKPFIKIYSNTNNFYLPVKILLQELKTLLQLNVKPPS